MGGGRRLPTCTRCGRPLPLPPRLRRADWSDSRPLGARNRCAGGPVFAAPDSLQEELAMINKYVAIGLGVLIALEPLAAVAQTEQLAQAAAPPAATEAAPAATHATRGSHRRHTRRQGREAARRARASARHPHNMSTAPAEAPKS